MTLSCREDLLLYERVFFFFSVRYSSSKEKNGHNIAEYDYIHIILCTNENTRLNGVSGGLKMMLITNDCRRINDDCDWRVTGSKSRTQRKMNF